jgi:MoxR-like ATPase
VVIPVDSHRDPHARQSTAPGARTARATLQDCPIGVPGAPVSGRCRRAALAGERYLAADSLCTALYVAIELGAPLLLEGEAGVGKTELAKALAAATGARLIRLQCHEGIDSHQALYDWDYERQLLAIRGAEVASGPTDLYDRRFLVRRPLLEAIETPEPVVLLIDELDRADDEFEAFLLELLSDFQVTIPEIGTITAAQRPVVIVTSNRTRELHDALKRRCLYEWIDYPQIERELEIVAARVPQAPARVVERVCRAVALLREQELYKRPGVGETIAWAQALLALSTDQLDATLFAVLKVREDVEHVRAGSWLDGV